ncbi:hypothetical protein GGP55_001408 [Salinibacter ruber]|uniref:hypothetical protein n=1 Tax=Salinibacter ruber TaxID=146919 RepID=UPI002167E2E5|nr:hypothetical protein [Salinibacter ruber]MCS3630809.1 hypothetical protein [Salinibacter ruber]
MHRTVSAGLRLVLLVGVLLITGVSSGQAQAPRGIGDGTAALEGWPRSLPTLLDEMGQDAPYLLPRIDSMALDYRYAATDTTSRWSFVVNWRPAERVLYEGEVLPWRERPAGVRMTNVELRANVRVDGEKRAGMIIGVDSMALRPVPDRFAFNVTVPHERVFLDVSPTEARRILAEGATLEGLVVERMGFTSDAAERTPRTGDGEARERRPEPSRSPSIYRPRSRIYIGWRVAPRPYYVGGQDEDDDRTRRPRGETVGRSAADTERSEKTGRDERTEGRRGARDDPGKEGEDDEADTEGRSRVEGILSDEDDEEDDEEETDLGIPALGAAAAVGIVAFAGGTAGLYGRGDTPIGLASGYTHPRGGVQLQAAVNSAVLEDGPDQELSFRALGFYDVFESRVQPALGLGAHIDPQAGRDWDPVVSAGVVGNLGRVVLYGGLDVMHGTPEVGISYNFRYDGGDE